MVKHARVSFSKTIKISRAKGRVQFEVFENSRVYVFPNSTRNRTNTYYYGVGIFRVKPFSS
jgi:hypothetical protein